MQPQKILYNFRNQFSYNFEPKATKSMTTGRSATSKIYKDVTMGRSSTSKL